MEKKKKKTKLELLEIKDKKSYIDCLLKKWLLLNKIPPKKDEFGVLYENVEYK